MLILLLVQEALKHPAGLGLDKVAVFVTLYGQNPASTDKILALYLSQVNQFKNIIVNPGLVFSLLGIDKVLIMLALELSSSGSEIPSSDRTDGECVAERMSEGEPSAVEQSDKEQVIEARRSSAARNTQS